MKKFLLPLLAFVFIISCGKESTTDLQPDQEIEENGSVTLRSPAPKIDVCHYDDENDTWHMINISQNAWPAHESHGDVQLVDADGDGWVAAENECVPGGDCDDNDAAVNPDADEIPYNGKDDDCNSATPDDDLDGDGFLNEDDCNDSNSAVNPDATEVCDNDIDDDCDGDVDEADSDCSTGCVEGEVEINFNGPLFVAPADELGTYTWQQAIDKCNQKDTDGCDWFLPSGFPSEEDELNALYVNKEAIGGFTNGIYWSSTEGEGSGIVAAGFQNFNDGGQGSSLKSSNFRCRCVRR